MANLLKQAVADALISAMKSGASVRQAQRQFGVARHTALEYQRISKHRSVPILPCPRAVDASARWGGENQTVVPNPSETEDAAPIICKATRQQKRIALWLDAGNEPIPENKRLGWTCDVPYCGLLEHMALAENLNHGRNNWDLYT